jgi:hypothetical protein
MTKKQRVARAKKAAAASARIRSAKAKNVQKFIKHLAGLVSGPSLTER